MTLNAPPYCRTLTCVTPVLFTFNLQTKLEISSIIRSKAMAWAPKCRKMGHVTLTTHTRGIVSDHKANTSRGQHAYKIWSLQLQQLQTYFRGCKTLQCHMTLPIVSGWLVISRLGLATINLQTKFEVSNYSHYKDMKSGAICRNWGSLGQLGVTQSHRQCHHSIQRIRLPTQLNWNGVSILYHFSRI